MTYFYTYEGDFSQPHETMQDAMSWLRDYDVDTVVEIEFDDNGEMVFAWDRTSEAHEALALSGDLYAILKDARDYQPKTEQERQAMDRFSAKIPKWSA